MPEDWHHQDKNLTFRYDRQGDINTCPPYPEQESEEIGGEVITRLNPKSGEIENIEVLFFLTRLLRTEVFDLSITPTPPAPSSADTGSQPIFSADSPENILRFSLDNPSDLC